VLRFCETFLGHPGSNLLHFVYQVDGGRASEHKAACWIVSRPRRFSGLEGVEARHAKLDTKASPVDVDGPDVVCEYLLDIREIDKLNLDCLMGLLFLRH
jgi:hypothetical protein